jgi:hypothetical protein
MNTVNKFLVNTKGLLFLFLSIAVFAALQSYFADLKTFEDNPRLYTCYNNYVIFKQSFFHLIEGKDLYILYLEEQWDLFKYSPAFALLFGLLAYLPDPVGLTLWAVLNATVLFYSVYYLPHIDRRTKGIILIFVFSETLTTLQNEQSNALIAGLLIFTFGFLEIRKYWLASFCIVSTIFIKLFGIVGLALYLLYPGKVKLAYTTLLWTAVFILLPLLVVDQQQFVLLYKSWANMLSNDHSISDGLSVIGWLKTWFNWQVNKTYVSLVGVVLFCIPLLRFKAYDNYQYRILTLASILIWVVIFNHRAESPTFIIAISGVALWYFSQEQSKINLVLLILALIFTGLSSTDLFPKFVRDQYVWPYVLKAVPCILVWGKILYDLTAGELLPRKLVEHEGL